MRLSASCTYDGGHFLLQMDFAVIQQGRLAEKHKNLSKEEALAAVRYGAEKVRSSPA
jgi:hypothetical protein